MPYKMIYRLPHKLEFFSGPLAFCKKAMGRVNSEKNILNSLVEWSRWSGLFLQKLYMYVYIIRSGSMSSALAAQRAARLHFLNNARNIKSIAR